MQTHHTDVKNLTYGNADEEEKKKLGSRSYNIIAVETSMIPVTATTLFLGISNKNKISNIHNRNYHKIQVKYYSMSVKSLTKRFDGNLINYYKERRGGHTWWKDHGHSHWLSYQIYML